MYSNIIKIVMRNIRIRLIYFHILFVYKRDYLLPETHTEQRIFWSTFTVHLVSYIYSNCPERRVCLTPTTPVKYQCSLQFNLRRYVALHISSSLLC